MSIQEKPPVQKTILNGTMYKKWFNLGKEFLTQNQLRGRDLKKTFQRRNHLLDLIFESMSSTTRFFAAALFNE